jgi:D-alanyl-D-alanine carboxypeptidase (penicillin-binding protein 5/6)
MKRKIGLLLILCLITSMTTQVFAAGLPTYGADQGVIIEELNSGDTVFQQKQNEKFYPASTTKLMTALVAVENADLSEKFTVGDEIDSLDADSSTAGLEVGEELTLKELLYALLLPSGNDAAETIAVNVGRKIIEKNPAGNTTETTSDSNSSSSSTSSSTSSTAGTTNSTATNSGNSTGKTSSTPDNSSSTEDSADSSASKSTISNDKAYDAFVKAMNDKAKALEMTGTNFKNPHGLHNDNHYTTPADLLKLAKAAFSNDTIKEITRSKAHELQTNQLKHKWYNSNILLFNNFNELPEDYRVANDLTAGTNPVFNGYATSGKTGFTEEANKCLVFEGEGNNKDMIGIILNADKSVVFKEASDTINAVVKEYDLIEWTKKDDKNSKVQVVNYHVFDGNTLEYKTGEPLVTLAKQSEKDQYETRVKWDDTKLMGDATLVNLKTDLKEGDQIGELQVYKGDTFVESTPVYAMKSMKARNWTDYPILYWYVTIIVILMVLAILRIMFVQFMRKNKIRYKKIKIKGKTGSKNGNRPSNRSPIGGSNGNKTGQSSSKSERRTPPQKR